MIFYLCRKQGLCRLYLQKIYFFKLFAERLHRIVFIALNERCLRAFSYQFFVEMFRHIRNMQTVSRLKLELLNFVVNGAL